MTKQAKNKKSNSKAEQFLKGFLERFPDWNVAPDLLIQPPSREELEAEYPEAGSDLLDRAGELMSIGCTRGAFYSLRRIHGTSHKFAEMLALQKGPGLDTDDVFFSEQKPLYDQFGSQKHLDKFLKVAKSKGFTPSVNSTYFAPLARFPGDPEAFVTRAQGRSYIKKLLDRRGWACDGGITADGREPEYDPHAKENRTHLAEDIIRDRARTELQRNPNMSKAGRKELREKIIAKHSGS